MGKCNEMTKLKSKANTYYTICDEPQIVRSRRVLHTASGEGQVQKQFQFPTRLDELLAQLPIYAYREEDGSLMFVYDGGVKCSAG